MVIKASTKGRCYWREGQLLAVLKYEKYEGEARKWVIFFFFLAENTGLRISNKRDITGNTWIVLRTYLNRKG